MFRLFSIYSEVSSEDHLEDKDFQDILMKFVSKKKKFWDEWNKPAFY